MSTRKVFNPDEPETFSANTANLNLGTAFAMVFFDRLFNWTQTGKKFRVVINYDPDGKTDVTMSKIKNDPN